MSEKSSDAVSYWDHILQPGSLFDFKLKNCLNIFWLNYMSGNWSIWKSGIKDHQYMPPWCSYSPVHMLFAELQLKFSSTQLLKQMVLWSILCLVFAAFSAKGWLVLCSLTTDASGNKCLRTTRCIYGSKLCFPTPYVWKFETGTLYQWARAKVLLMNKKINRKNIHRAQLSFLFYQNSQVHVLLVLYMYKCFTVSKNV